MILVFEGVNKVGKTSLMSILSKELNMPVFRNGRHPDMDGIKKHCNFNDYNEDVTVLNFIRTLGTANIMLDRSLTSDYVYKSVMGEKFPFPVLTWWMKVMKEIGGIYVYVKSNWNEISSRNNGSKIDYELYKELNLWYDELFVIIKSQDIKTIYVNNVGDINLVSKELINQIIYKASFN